VGDAVALPKDLATLSCYDEKVLYLPHSLLPTDHRTSMRFMLDPSDEFEMSRKDYGLPEDAFVFCCFANLSKLHPACFDAW